MNKGKKNSNVAYFFNMEHKNDDYEEDNEQDDSQNARSREKNYSGRQKSFRHWREKLTATILVADDFMHSSLKTLQFAQNHRTKKTWHAYKKNNDVTMA